MAKKIRFPLKMENEIEVRTLSELQANFSLTRVLDYASDGKLVTWLRDRYIDTIADAIEKLDINNMEFPKQLCEIFSINNVAFCQDDLYDLLDEQYDTIYLYGDRFEIPLDKGNMTYIGFNNPVVIIHAKEEVNWKEKNITLSKVQFDDKYKKLLEDKKNSYQTVEDDNNGSTDHTKDGSEEKPENPKVLLDKIKKSGKGRFTVKNATNPKISSFKIKSMDIPGNSGIQPAAKESLEEVYKRFRLERGGTNFDNYVGKLGSVTWKFLVTDEDHQQYLQDAKTYVGVIYDNLEMLEEKFNTEPKILYNSNKWIKHHRREDDTVESEHNISRINSFTNMSISNGFNLQIYTDGRLTLVDNRQRLLDSKDLTVID